MRENTLIWRQPPPYSPIPTSNIDLYRLKEMVYRSN